MNIGNYKLIGTACQTAEKGVSVFRVGNDKLPVGPWKQLQTTALTPQQVLERMTPDAVGYAVVCGKVSGGLEVLDFDVDGFYERWVDAAGDIANGLPVQRTGGGGYQVAWRCDNPDRNQKLAWAKNDKYPGGKEVAIETRGEGGYAVAAPSIHPSGNRYEWLNGKTFGDAPHLSAIQVGILKDAARKLSEVVDEVPAAAPAAPAPKLQGVAVGESVIDAYNAANPIEATLERYGYTYNPLGRDYTRPGPDASPGGVTILDGKSYHHSTNDELNNGHANDAFDLFTQYEHDGDQSKATAAAAELLGIGREKVSINTEALVANANAKAKKGSGEGGGGEFAPLIPVPLGELIAANPVMRAPLIDGVLRLGETGNFVAASKTGKSWLVNQLAITVATGDRWLGTFDCKQGRVLIIDNELDATVIADRLPKTARAMGVNPEVAVQMIDVLALRGNLRTLDQLASTFDSIGRDTYQLIVLDAWYRLLPSGMSENSNSDIMQLYNTLDKYGLKTNAAIVAVHHTSKGDQGGKSVTDTGAGAGSQSRAADAHIVLRAHEEEGHAVLDAAVRSFAPIDPVPLKFEWPLWGRADELDVTKLKGVKTKNEARNQANDAEGIRLIVEALKSQGPLTTRKVRDHAGGMGRDRADRLLGKLLTNDKVTSAEVRVRGRDATEWRLAT